MISDHHNLNAVTIAVKNAIQSFSYFVPFKKTEYCYKTEGIRSHRFFEIHSFL